MEVWLFLHVHGPTPVLVRAWGCRAGPGASAAAAVLGQTKFGSSCAKSKQRAVQFPQTMIYQSGLAHQQLCQCGSDFIKHIFVSFIFV